MTDKQYPLQLKKDYCAVTANDLIRGKQKMTTREAQLLYIAIAQVVKEDKDFKTYTTTVPELAAFMGIDTDSLYRDLKGICESLLQRIVKIRRGKNKWEAFQWINNAKYDNGKLTLRLSDDIKPYLLELEKYYSQTLLGTLLAFESYYTIRLYQLIICESGQAQGRKEEWTFTIEELRDFFQTGKKYELPRNLLNKTIKVALSELNQSDYMYIWDYEEHHKPTKGNPLESVSFKAIPFQTREEKEYFLNRAKPIIDRLNVSKV